MVIAVAAASDLVASAARLFKVATSTGLTLSSTMTLLGTAYSARRA